MKIGEEVDNMVHLLREIVHKSVHLDVRQREEISHQQVPHDKGTDDHNLMIPVDWLIAMSVMSVMSVKSVKSEKSAKSVKSVMSVTTARIWSIVWNLLTWSILTYCHLGLM